VQRAMHDAVYRINLLDILFVMPVVAFSAFFGIALCCGCGSSVIHVTIATAFTPAKDHVPQKDSGNTIGDIREHLELALPSHSDSRYLIDIIHR
jgi:hypothetical protein